jgi:hypothetical protein
VPLRVKRGWHQAPAKGTITIAANQFGCPYNDQSVGKERETSELRLAELVVPLALATDLARGQPMEHELRTCLLAVRLGELLGLDEGRLSEVYYVALLRWIGCTGHAHELSAWFNDEIAAHARAATFDFGRPAELITDMVRFAGAGSPPMRRIQTVLAALAGDKRDWKSSSAPAARSPKT